jgi:hypothetical protein
MKISVTRIRARKEKKHSVFWRKIGQNSRFPALSGIKISKTPKTAQNANMGQIRKIG